MRNHTIMLAYYHRWATRRVANTLMPTLMGSSPTGFTRRPAFSPPLQQQPAAAAASLTGAEIWSHPMQMPCGSIFGTLAHLYFAERLWLHRFRGEPVPKEMSELWESPATAAGRATTVVDVWTQAYQKKDPTNDVRMDLIADLNQLGEEWIELAKASTEPELAGKLEYTTTSGEKVQRVRAALFQHVFNHGTHHRGQVSAAISQFGAPYPRLDLNEFLPEWDNIHGKVRRWD